MLLNANAQGSNGLCSPHVDIIVGKDAVNFAKVNTKTFTCSFDSNGYIKNITPESTGHNLGDIAYWDGSKVAFTPYTSWNSSLGTALAVCFIPSSHATVWGDGKARFLSVKGVNADGTASDVEQAIWWDSQRRGAGLTPHLAVPIWDNTVGGSTGAEMMGFISTDCTEFFDEPEQNVIDTLSYYSGEKMLYTPSPYTADGSFYSDYIRTLSDNNALSDLNGKTNTSTIVNALGTTGGEAAKACSLYSTNGISAGEWYLPACGELVYIAPRFNVINAALTVCGGLMIGTGKGGTVYWTSTELGNPYNEYYVWGMMVDNGMIYPLPVFAEDTSEVYARPVCALS